MVDGSTVAGKTGTARKASPEGRGYLADSYVTSFAGMLPAAEPDFVCLVVIDDPTTTGVARYGGTTAAPVFSRIAGEITKSPNGMTHVDSDEVNVQGGTTSEQE